MKLNSLHSLPLVLLAICISVAAYGEPLLLESYEHTVYVDCSNPNATDDATCGSHTHPCCTFSYAVSERVLNSTQVVVSSGNYSLNCTISLSGLTNIALIGIVNGSSQPVVTVTCESGAGLSFVHSSGITIQNVHFSGCGALQNSTSRNFSDHSFSFMQFPVGMYFLFCQRINLTGVSVTNSTGTGMAVYATGGLNYIHNCSFLYNRPPNNNCSFLENTPSRFGGGGLYIEFPYCSPTNQTSCTTIQDSEYNSNASYNISESLFSGNVALETEASIHESQYNFLPPDPHYHNTAGHGGGIALYLCRANDIHISVTECKIERNKAYFGGGIVVSFEEYSVNNRVEVFGSTFSDNHCVYRSAFGGSGGGMTVLFKFSYQASHTHNSMSANHSHFANNTAYFGGGSVIKASPEMEQTDPTNSVYFNECVWTGNYGTVGAALLASAYNISAKRGALLKPVFESCTFENNTGDIPGIVTADYLPIAFSTNVKFLNNGNSSQASSPLTIDQTRVDFLENCQATFHHNKAAYGGAISLHGYAFIIVHRNTSLNFSRNYAQREGGAIYQDPTNTGLLTSGNCFVQYINSSVHPKDWETNFIFDFNRENVHTSNPECNAMVLGSLIPCIWNGYTYSRSQNEMVLSKVFCSDRNNWTFRSNSTNCSCSNQTRTLPNRMTNKSLNVIPGLRSPLNITLLDDYSKNVTKYAVLNVWPATNSAISLPPNALYVTDDSLVMYGESMHNGTLDVDTLPPRHLFASVPVHFQQCPPGFVQTNTTDGHKTCSCERGGFEGSVQCDGSGNANLRRGMWIGKVRSSDDYVVGQSPHIRSGAYSSVVLPQNNVSALDDLLCGQLNREGTLCGRCKKGYGFAVSTYICHHKCVHCKGNSPKYGWTYVAFELILITGFFLIVMTFNISATSGAMNAFVFFAQVMAGSFSINASGDIPLETITHRSDSLVEIYASLYGIWRLDFIFPNLCLSPHLTAQNAYLLLYFKAIYPVFLILVFLAVVWLHDHGVQPFYSCGKWVSRQLRRLRKPWTVQKTVIHALATFLVLSFTKFTELSFFILAPARLIHHDGSIVTWVPRYYGELKYLSAVHIPYFLVATLFLILFVILPTLLLLLLPARTKWGKLFFNKAFKILHINPDGRLHIFLQTFQGSFKDGSGSKGEINCQIFAGIYLLLRFVIFMLASLLPSRDYLIYQQFVCSIAILLFAIFRPYRENRYNILDISAFTLLGTINLLTIFNSLLVAVDVELSPVLFTVQYVLVFVPLIIMIIWFSYTIIKHCCGKHIKLKSFQSTDTPSTIDSAFLDFRRDASLREGESRHRNRCISARKKTLESYNVVHDSAGGEEECNDESSPLIASGPTYGANQH